ncbi:DUF6660 family protein [Echinicola sp. 20G]|uniref:DUF6660 family protein n=1 Tax=Echinicola sp. 20G TaxID=2781961 RepID=UPI0019108897|nr:DUF6660 family protein [Echinicola sp. 20G]
MQIILRYYLLVLMVLPCADGDDVSGTFSEVAMIANHDAGHHHGDMGDDCSPLCVCHCCHIHFMITQEPSVNFVSDFIAVNNAYYHDFIGIQLFDFLKPPRS